jgi:hypothetical protein
MMAPRVYGMFSTVMGRMLGSVSCQVSSIKKISSGRASGVVDHSPRMVYLKMEDGSQQVGSKTTLHLTTLVVDI